jgi:hypothetical protein
MGQGHEALSVKPFWLIEGYERFDRFFQTQLPGHMSDEEITTIIQRLACRHLSEAEIVAASLRKGKRTSLLEPLIGKAPHGLRTVISINHGTEYRASYWRADETPPD